MANCLENIFSSCNAYNYTRHADRSAVFMYSDLFATYPGHRVQRSGHLFYDRTPTVNSLRNKRTRPGHRTRPHTPATEPSHRIQGVSDCGQTALFFEDRSPTVNCLWKKSCTLVAIHTITRGIADGNCYKSARRQKRILGMHYLANCFINKFMYQ